eukprot:scaffold10678_cov130-Skeletonema_marinoi.AAC.10
MSRLIFASSALSGMSLVAALRSFEVFVDQSLPTHPDDDTEEVNSWSFVGDKDGEDDVDNSFSLSDKADGDDCRSN